MRFDPLRVVHVRLDEPLVPLEDDGSGRGVYAVFWSGDVPLGDLYLAPQQLPVGTAQLSSLAAGATAEALTELVLDGATGPGTRPGPPAESSDDRWSTLRAVTRPLSKLRERQPVAPLVSDGVSVVVCTRDRPRQVQASLESVLRSTTAPKEIVVVDNAPDRPAGAAAIRAIPGVTYVPEPRPGLSVARNTGIAHCTGDVIAFTDDDAEVHPGWIAALEPAFADPDVMAVTGLVLPAALDTEAQVAFERFVGGFNRGYRPRTYDESFVARTRARGVPVWEMGAGANMAVRRRAFELVGPFDVRLGAGAAGCSEDTELWYRLLAEGWKCRYEPSAVVFHHHRSEVTALERQAFDYLRGHTAALWVQFARYRHWGNVRRAVLTLPPSLTGRLARHVLVSSPLERRVARAELAGHLAGLTMVGLAAPARLAASSCPPGPAAPDRTGTTPCDCS